MIDKKYQNQGIGKLAVQKFLDFFVDKYGHKKLYTSAEFDNIIAINLYGKSGFEKREAFEYEVSGVKYREIRMVIQL